MADFYNVAHYTSVINVEPRKAFRGIQLGVGRHAPGIRLPTVDPDGEFVLAELTEQRAVALIFGSLTAPPCRRELPAIDALGQALGDRDGQIVFVYTREAHPGELIPAHETMAQKTAAARRLKGELDLALTVAVDSVEGTTHLAYGGLPFMTVVVDRGGTVIHRSEWASAAQLATVFENLASREAWNGRDLPCLVSYSETLWFVDGGTLDHHNAVLRSAGESAVADAAGGPPDQELWSLER